MAAKIRKGDKVIVLSGRDKGRTGEVFEVRPDDSKALVRGVNLVKRHQKQTQAQEGGIISRRRRSTCPTSRSSARTASRPRRFQDSRGWQEGTRAKRSGAEIDG